MFEASLGLTVIVMGTMVTLDRRNVLFFHSYYPSTDSFLGYGSSRKDCAVDFSFISRVDVCLCHLKVKSAPAAVIHDVDVFLVNPSGVCYTRQASVWNFVPNVVL